MSEVKLNKNNISGVINAYLNKKGVRFKLDTNSNDFSYKLDIQDSISTYIQIESYKDNDEELIFTFWITLNYNDEALYENETNNKDDLEENLETLIDNSFNYGRAIKKIKSKVESIIEICEEYDINYEHFILIEYNYLTK
jgi:hypothetical protein